jgi:hypothetical protein
LHKLVSLDLSFPGRISIGSQGVKGNPVCAQTCLRRGSRLLETTEPGTAAGNQTLNETDLSNQVFPWPLLFAQHAPGLGWPPAHTAVLCRTITGHFGVSQFPKETVWVSSPISASPKVLAQLWIGSSGHGTCCWSFQGIPLNVCLNQAETALIPSRNRRAGSYLSSAGPIWKTSSFFQNLPRPHHAEEVI